MAGLSPTERIQQLGQISNDEQTTVNATAVLDCYEQFLDRVNQPEDQLISEFIVSNPSREARLAQLVYELLSQIGHGNHFYRLLMV